MATSGPCVLEGVELTSENVERAVLQFYQSSASSQETIQETHKWLTLAQLSPQAWNFCWDLIQQDKKHEVQFFGASCLAVKVILISDWSLLILSCDWSRCPAAGLSCPLTSMTGSGRSCWTR